MQGYSEGAGGLFAVGEVAPGLVGGGTVYSFLAAHRLKLFPEASFADLFPSGKGRPSTPGSVVAAMLLLQAMEGLSDRQASERAQFDLRWKAACGLAVDERAPEHTVLVYWRKRIAASADPDRVFRAVAVVVEACGALRGKRRRVVDSTVVDDAVARQDTVKLLVWQIHRVRALLPELASWIDSQPGGGWYKDRLKPDIDWASELAREDLVTVLVNDAFRLVERAADAVDARAAVALSEDVEWDRGPFDDQVGLLALLAGQDVEPAPDSTDWAPRWRIARRVAPERVISVVDVEARHVRKSRASKRDGYKAHVAAEPDTGLVTDAGASSGAGEGSSDAANGAAMLAAEAAAGGGVDQALGDSAYDSGEFLDTCDTLGVEPVVKPRPLRTAVAGGVSIDDFQTEQDANGNRRVRCPGAFKAPMSQTGRADFTPFCHRCVIRHRCTNAKDGRIVTLDAKRLRARRHRQAARDPVFQETYRQVRPMAERAISWLVRPGRRSPYRGLAKTHAWIRRRAAAVNLKRLVNMGLDNTQGTWTLPETAV
jgi:hypothetical protein